MKTKRSEKRRAMLRRREERKAQNRKAMNQRAMVVAVPTTSKSSTRPVSVEIKPVRMPLPIKRVSPRVTSRIFFGGAVLCGLTIALIGHGLAFRVGMALLAVIAGVLLIGTEMSVLKADWQSQPSSVDKYPAEAAMIRWGLVTLLVAAEALLPHGAAAALWTMLYANLFTKTYPPTTWSLRFGILAMAMAAFLYFRRSLYVTLVMTDPKAAIGSAETIALVVAVGASLLLPTIAGRIARFRRRRLLLAV